MKNPIAAGMRGATALVATGLLVCAGTAAFADSDVDDTGVDVQVDISEVTEPGVLALSVASTSATLVEQGSTATVRQFVGALPTVTVTDTRTAEQIPEGAAWYVLGSATPFLSDSGADPIGADHLGWQPRLLDGGESGLVTEGEPVQTALDSGPDAVGLVDQELLALTVDSQAVAAEGRWTADADLFLRTEPGVTPGRYSSVITLSLFE